MRIGVFRHRSPASGNAARASGTGSKRTQASAAGRKEEPEGEWKDVLDIVVHYHRQAARYFRMSRTNSSTTWSATSGPRPPGADRLMRDLPHSQMVSHDPQPPFTDSKQSAIRPEYEDSSPSSRNLSPRRTHVVSRLIPQHARFPTVQHSRPGRRRRESSVQPRLRNRQES
jgi:hypothetical protein